MRSWPTPLVSVVAISIITAATATATAEPVEDARRGKSEDADHDQLVLINAVTKLGTQGPVAKIKRVFDARGLLRELPEGLEETFDGRNLQLRNVEAIRSAYTNLEFDTALRLIDENETRILQNAAGGDPLPALTELSQWRGLIATGQDRPDEAISWFRTALRFNPAWIIDKKLAAPSVNKLVKKARRDLAETGRLRVDADPENAMVQIDGGKAQPANEKITLPIGWHLVVVTADGRTTYAELVEIEADKLTKLPISLDVESKTERAAKLVDATISAPSGKPRLKKTRALSNVTGGAKLYLFVEDGGEDKVTLRVYDIGQKKVSKPFEIEIDASSTSIHSKVMAALDADSMVEPASIMVIEKDRPPRWYERWYVWAGIAALAGGSYLGVQYMTREPTAVRGF